MYICKKKKKSHGLLCDLWGIFIIKRAMSKYKYVLRLRNH